MPLRNDIDMNDNRVAMDHDGQYIAIDTTSFVNITTALMTMDGWMELITAPITINGGMGGKEKAKEKGRT